MNYQFIKISIASMIFLFSGLGSAGTVHENSLSANKVQLAFGEERGNRMKPQGNRNRDSQRNFRGHQGNNQGKNFKNNNANNFNKNNINNVNGNNVNNFHKNSVNNVNGYNTNVYTGGGTVVNTGGASGAYYYQGTQYPTLGSYCRAACVVASNGQRTCPNICH